MHFSWPLVIAAISGTFLKLGPTQKPLMRVLIKFDFATQICQWIVTYCNSREKIFSQPGANYL